MGMGESRVLECAIGSRILVVTLIIVWRSLLSPYDTSASLNPTCLSPTSHSPHPTPLFPSIASSIEGSIVWDSVYFLRNAHCGYEYEHSYAFLPLLPFLITSLSATVFRPLVPVIGYRAVLGLSGYLISNVAFVFAALYLYRLSVIILRDQEASLRASILFCFNPASIFYSSIYSESLYALLSIGGLYHLMTGANNVPVLWFALSAIARSNGVLNAGYYGFQTLHRSYYAMTSKKHGQVLQVLFVGALRCIFIFIPFLAYQAYAYYNICSRRNAADEMRPWCKAKIPLLYSFIQSHYWGVGFLRYFQLKQLPNFLLASPVLLLALCSVQSYIKAKPEIFFSLGFRAASKAEDSANVLLPGGENQKRDYQHASKPETTNFRRRQNIMRQETDAAQSESDAFVKSGYCSLVMLPFIYHLGFMTATAFFVMHVQVATRFLSASPPLFWFASYMMTCVEKKRWAYLIWAYAITYVLLGSLLFSNFYPFT